MLQEETRADIQPAAGKNVGVVMDGPRRAVQLPAVGLRRIGKLRSGENAVDQTRFFQASEVVVVPRIFSNSASVELCTSRAFAAA